MLSGTGPGGATSIAKSGLQNPETRGKRTLGIGTASGGKDGDGLVGGDSGRQSEQSSSSSGGERSVTDNVADELERQPAVMMADGGATDDGPTPVDDGDEYADTESEGSYKMPSVREIRSRPGHGTDEALAPKYDLEDMSAYEFRQEDPETQVEILEHAAENGNLDELSGGIDEIGDKDFMDHLKAGGKKGGIKAIAKGGAVFGGAALAGGAAGLPAIGAAAAVGMAAGFGAGTVKSVGMERLKDWNRDYTTMEGITNEAPKDIGNLADNIGDFLGSSAGDKDIERTTSETGDESQFDEEEYFSGDSQPDDEFENEQEMEK
ncbi:hypothetical protein [Halorubellus sp. PRR65]|uniref:hypothetical protein n=1 Tax=Halorubellus sp. PRR65 TaxID=3098148 RepID=UPI002B26240E|nr:hypothetical protein [Halorubellus sp. PRR65]